VVRVLDIPDPGDHRERQAFEDQLHERVYRMVGALTGALSSGYSTQTSIIATLGEQAAQPLRYTPETPEQAAEREARTAARLAEYRAERARIASSANEVPGLSHG
jgi:hypothetical protein